MSHRANEGVRCSPAASQLALAPSRASNGHHVQFYEDDAFLAQSVGVLMGNALLAGEAALVIAPADRRRDIEAQWASRGLDAEAARERGQYVPLDAAETLSKFTVAGVLEPSRFVQVVGGAIRDARARYPTVQAFGEMVALLWEAGDRDGAVRLEEMWNELAKTHAFSLLCAYPMRAFADERVRPDFLRVCDTHDGITPAESFSAVPHRTDRMRVVSELQQTARAYSGIVVDRDNIAAHLNEILAERLNEQVTANRRKDEFLAMLGHELRNPLSAARNAVIHARLGSGPTDRALEIAHRQLDQLTRLVDDLLDVARITEGKIRLQIASVSLRDQVATAVENSRELVGEHGHTLAISLPPDALTVDADPLRIQQVLANFLTNAAKYTPAGGRIEVVAERVAEWAVVRVRDNGVGIAADVLPNVFDLFTQGKRDLDRSQGGLGIGLTIARRLVELHGGTVEALSEGQGRGAEFVMRLPLRAAADAPATDAERAAPVDGADGVSVLLVEDNVDVADSLCLLLESYKHEVHVARDGHQAIDAVRERAFEVALVDIGLPGLDGYEVATRLHALPNGATTILVALTGYGQPEDQRRADAAGFARHFVKPVSLDALEDVFAVVRARRSAGSNDRTAR